MLYKLSTGKAKEKPAKAKRITLAEIGWLEKDLEELISNNIDDLIYSNDLMVIFTERPAQPEPDILALDAKGNLYIFELKRWDSQCENLLQVLRYGQLYGRRDYEALDDLYKKKYPSSKSLLDAHAKYFDLSDDDCLKEEDFNKTQKFIIVTNGLDQETMESIVYWRGNGLKIDAITYWVYEIKGEHFIEFDMYSPVEGFLAYESHAFVLNTNEKNDPQCTQEMICEKKAAAYYPGWMEKIQKLQKGDCVFLYQSGKGVIAYGIADGKLEKKDYDGNPDYEYYMRLTDFQELRIPMSASEMKRIANKGFPFRMTMYSLSEEVKNAFIDNIRKNHL